MYMRQNDDFLFAEIYQRKSNISIVFERDNKEFYDKEDGKTKKKDEFYEKYLREYFIMVNLEQENSYPIETKKVDIGTTLLAILNEKDQIIQYLTICKRNIDMFDYNNNYCFEELLAELRKCLLELDSNLEFIAYLVECFLLELNCSWNEIEHSIREKLENKKEQRKEDLSYIDEIIKAVVDKETNKLSPRAEEAVERLTIGDISAQATVEDTIDVDEKLRKIKFDKFKKSMKVYFEDLIDQLMEAEDIIYMFFIYYKEYTQESIPEDESDMRLNTLYEISSRNYNNTFTIPEAIHKYKIYNYYPIIVKSEYQINSITELVYSTIYHFSLNKKNIYKCKICEKYFIPTVNDKLCCSNECSNKNKQKITLDNLKKPYAKANNRITKWLKDNGKQEKLKNFKKRYEKEKEVATKICGKATKEYDEHLLKWLLQYEEKHINKYKKR